MDPITGLPDRSQLVSTLTEMLAESEKPALFAVSIDGYDSFAGQDPTSAEAAMREVGSRLSRLVRSNDVLGVLAPGVFALAGPGVEAADTEVLLERIRGVFAMPVEVGGSVVSFPITVGVAHHDPAVDAAAMVVAAEEDLSRHLDE